MLCQKTSTVKIIIVIRIGKLKKHFCKQKYAQKKISFLFFFIFSFSRFKLKSTVSSFNLVISIQTTLYFHVQKKQPKTSGANPMPQSLPALNLFPDFYPITKGEKCPAVRIDRCIIHKPVKDFMTLQSCVEDKSNQDKVPAGTGVSIKIDRSIV